MARGKRKRKRRAPRAAPASRPDAAEAAEPASASPSRPARRRPGPDDPPPAPWAPFPLVELVVLVAIVILVAGFIVGGTQGGVMIGTGLLLGSLAGLELSAREHFSGYRSHTLLLAGAAAIGVLAALVFLVPDVNPILRIAIAAVAFGLAAWLLTAAFRRRSGGLRFRVR